MKISTHLFIITLRLIFNFCSANAINGKWEDNTCFNENFGNLTNMENTSKVGHDYIMVKIENYEDTYSAGNDLLSQNDLILKKGEKVVFTFQNRASSWPFHEISPRNLTLFFDGKTVYGAIGRLEISVGLKENMEQKLV